MAKLMLIVLLFLFALMALAAALYAWLGWVGLLIAFVAVIVLALLARAMAGWLLHQLFLTPFKMKGAVLRDAAAEVHAVIPAEAPKDEDEPLERTDDMSDEEWAEMQADWEAERQARKARRFFQVEVTITPREPKSGGFTMWEPGDLSLAPPDARGGDLDEEDAGNIAQVQIWDEGAWRDDEGLKYYGQRRLKLLVGVPPQTARARFRYYLEVFGHLDFAADQAT